MQTSTMPAFGAIACSASVEYRDWAAQPIDDNAPAAAREIRVSNDDFCCP